ncbi:hypothetical protein L3Q82_002618 [Scortum barcoo]|uniref:Uncharacterized protein n=1 Tax=Scortum barcoo TaxID=214431 RepID=A0ACB8VUB5_9TELE|nr:hypothetical protein L3Q82_002618 [Scortum barcoo]
MVVDFRRPRPHPEPVIIKGDCVEVVHTYKYLGVQLDDKLDWTANTDALCRKGQSRLYFLRRLASFNICKEAATDLLPVCGIERPPVHSSVLGGQPQEEGQSAPGQTGGAAASQQAGPDDENWIFVLHPQLKGFSVELKLIN